MRSKQKRSSSPRSCCRKQGSSPRVWRRGTQSEPRKGQKVDLASVGVPLGGGLHRATVHNFVYAKVSRPTKKPHRECMTKAVLTKAPQPYPRDGILRTGGSYFQKVDYPNGSPSENPAVRAVYRAYPAAIATSVGFCWPNNDPATKDQYARFIRRTYRSSSTPI